MSDDYTLYANLSAPADFDVRLRISCAGLSNSQVQCISDDAVQYIADRIEDALRDSA